MPQGPAQAPAPSPPGSHLSCELEFRAGVSPPCKAAEEERKVCQEGEFCQSLLGLTWIGDMARASISRDQRKIHIFRTPAHRQRDGEAPRPRTGRGSTLLTTEEPKRTKRAAFSRYHHSLGSIPRGARAGREFSPGTKREEAGLRGS